MQSQLSEHIDQIVKYYVPEREIESGLDRYYEKYYGQVLRRYPSVGDYLYVIGMMSILLCFALSSFVSDRVMYMQSFVFFTIYSFISINNKKNSTNIAYDEMFVAVMDTMCTYMVHKNFVILLDLSDSGYSILSSLIIYTGLVVNLYVPMCVKLNASTRYMQVNLIHPTNMNTMLSMFYFVGIFFSQYFKSNFIVFLICVFYMYNIHNILNFVHAIYRTINCHINKFVCVFTPLIFVVLHRLYCVGSMYYSNTSESYDVCEILSMIIATVVLKWAYMAATVLKLEYMDRDLDRRVTQFLAAFVLTYVVSMCMFHALVG